LALALPQHFAPFSELALLLLFCVVVGAIFVRLRQPLLITYIFAGIVLGPAGFGLVHAQSSIEVFAQLGVTVLLFIVGLKLDFQRVRHIGPVALATGLGQLTFTIVIGFLLLLLLGRGVIESLYVAVALTFSSTIIIVKLLSDKHELDTLHGRIAVGFLVVQDIAVVIAMMAMSAARDASAGSALDVGLSLLLRVAAAAVVVVLMARWVLPRVLQVMARSQELLLLFAVAWCVALAALGEWGGFSKEAGAFLAGFTLASTPYRDAMSTRLTTLRDFLLLFFFIELGAGLNLAVLGDELGPAMLLSVFVLVGNPLIVMAIMGFMGYRKRTGFLAGLTVAQISEFSIVFVALGISLGHIGGNALGLTTLVGMVTITASTYLILYSVPLYERVAPLLSFLERKNPFRETEAPIEGEGDAPEVIVFGLGRYGHRVFTRLREAGVRTLGVDFDPEVVRNLRAYQWPVRFGDVEDGDFLGSLPLEGVRWVVTSLPEWEANRVMFDGLRRAGFAGRIAVAVRESVDDAALEEEGVTRILHPFADAADHAADDLIEDLRRQGSDR
jgi:Kef-type K+ transport system membrane component KefB